MMAWLCVGTAVIFTDVNYVQLAYNDLNFWIGQMVTRSFCPRVNTLLSRRFVKTILLPNCYSILQTAVRLQLVTKKCVVFFFWRNTNNYCFSRSD